MSWLSNAWKAVKKGATDVGHTVGSVASNPWVDAATAAVLAGTGVGAPAAAAIMAAEKGGGNLLKKGGNIGSAATGAIQGGLEGYTAGRIGGNLGAARADVGQGNWLQAAKDTAGALGKTMGMPGATMPQGAPTPGGTAGGTGQPGGGQSNWMNNAVMLAAMAQAALDRQQAAKLTQQGIDYSKQAYDEKAPLRQKAISGLTNPPAPPNLSALFQDPGNVYSTGRSPVPVPPPPY